MFANKKIAVIIAAGGSGRRLKSAVPKQFVEIQGKPILARTMEVFEKSEAIDEILVVSNEAYLSYCKKEIIEKYRFQKVFAVIAGGKERQDSIYHAIEILDKSVDYVLVHDGARPYVTEEVIIGVLEKALKHQAAAAAVPAKDTIKVMEADCFVHTPDRRFLYHVQTPQGFEKKLLKRAYEKAYEDGFYGTDDAMLVERLKEKVYFSMGDYKNIKITTPEDLAPVGAKSQFLPRIGTGYDVHQLTENRKLILGGVHIPFEKGLLGHSDADVLLHAIMDAMLGAASLGDIGKHFPDKDPAYKDSSSLILLERVGKLVDEKGYKLGNLDCTVIAERPKIAPFINEMTDNITKALNLKVGQINIKATTTEELGFCGRGEGIAAQASAILFEPITVF
ncbi:MAG: 2-C-methyl-D-erythritol 4-phosphate cytidylyltransferase [Anaerovorax sp.]